MMRRKWFDILFSFSGRIDREHFWFGHLLALAMAVAIGILCAFVTEVVGKSPVVFFAFGMALLTCVCMSLPLTVKRLHDLNMSGAWIFAGLVPYLGGFWLLAVTGFKRGDEGANTYGEPNSWRTKVTPRERLRKKAQRVKRRALQASTD